MVRKWQLRAGVTIPPPRAPWEKVAGESCPPERAAGAVCPQEESQFCESEKLKGLSEKRLKT